MKFSTSGKGLEPEFFTAGTFKEYYPVIESFFTQDKHLTLGNPCWLKEQREKAYACAQNDFLKNTSSKTATSRLLIASGGSGGEIRLIAHTRESLNASAVALIDFLTKKISPRAQTLNCFSCLPPWHISGIMPFVRSRCSHGRLFVAEKGSFHNNESLPNFRESPDEFWMNSLVPTQLYRLLEHCDGIDWLRQFDFILLGGASVPATLLERIKKTGIKLGLGYGMTETASLIALGLEPDFYAGTLLPHAQITLRDEGRICIAASSLSPDCGNEFATNDEGFFDMHGKIHIRGRLDRFINSGGEKIDPRIVENTILKTNLVQETLVLGEADEQWGMRAVALLVGCIPETVPALKIALKNLLPGYMIPKRFLCVPALPIDEKGKLKRESLKEILQQSSSKI